MQKLARDFAVRCSRPLVLDADGLFPVREDRARLAAGAQGRDDPDAASGRGGAPARRHIAAINRDRVGAARRIATEAASVVVLKGAATVIAAPDGRTALNPTGGPALGTGGTGDVLTGIVVALLAQGMGAFEAAALGAWLHGFAGDRVSARRGRSGILASDVAADLPEACEALRVAPGSAERSALALPFP